MTSSKKYINVEILGVGGGNSLPEKSQRERSKSINKIVP